jgi:hypothetical protein
MKVIVHFHKGLPSETFTDVSHINEDRSLARQSIRLYWVNAEGGKSQYRSKYRRNVIKVEIHRNACDGGTDKEICECWGPQRYE